MVEHRKFADLVNKVAREKSYRERNENYNKNTIRSIIKSQKLQNI